MLYIYIYIYHNLVTEMQAAVAIISVSRSIHHKLSFHCHVMYIFPKYFMYVCVYFQNKGIRIRYEEKYQYLREKNFSKENQQYSAKKFEENKIVYNITNNG